MNEGGTQVPTLRPLGCVVEREYDDRGTPLYPRAVSGYVPFCNGNVTGGGFFCLVCCVGYTSNCEVCDATTEGNAPWRSQGGACLPPPREKNHRSGRCAYKTALAGVLVVGLERRLLLAHCHGGTAPAA